MVSASVTLNHPHAAAILEGFFFCINSFIYIPLFVVEKINQGIIKMVIPQKARDFLTCCCSVEDRQSQFPLSQSAQARHLLDWSRLRASVRSAFTSEWEANNSIVHVTISLLQSSCYAEESNHRAPSLFLEALCFNSPCCNSSSCIQWQSRPLSEVHGSLATSLLIQPRDSERHYSNPRIIIRSLLTETRNELRADKSSLQQPLQGFDSWQQLASSLNPFHSEKEPQVTVNGTIAKRSMLHKRMCRINKWQLLLRLHHMPWLRVLRRHALVHPPSQPNLAWRSTTMLLSSQILNAAAAAVSTEMHSMLDANKKQQHSGVDLFDRSISTFRGAVDLQAIVLSYFQSERSRAFGAAPERAVGCGCCPGADPYVSSVSSCMAALPCKRKQKKEDGKV